MSFDTAFSTRTAPMHAAWMEASPHRRRRYRPERTTYHVRTSRSRMTGDFVTNLKHGLGAGLQDPWIFVGNFEVEKYWAGRASALPSVSFA